MVSYKLVPEHNGVELYFDEKPSTSVCNELKAAGWRWHSVKRCWFTKKSDKSLALAKKFSADSEEQKYVPSSFNAHNAQKVQTAEVRFDQNTGSTYISSVTITKTQNECHISSTNNQIICCDCGRFFSVHAPSCPFCGCPMSYIAEHYLKKFDSKVLAEQKRQRELEIQRQQKAEAQRKATLIRKLKTDCKYYRSAFDELGKLDAETFNKAIDRAFHVESMVGNTRFISDENWHEMLLSSEMVFQKCVKRAVEINKHIDELSNIRNNWKHMISLSDWEFEKYIREELEKYRAKEIKKIEDMCQWRKIPPEKTAWLIDNGVTSEELWHRFSYIDYASKEYRRYNFNLKDYIHLSVAEMQKLVASWLK